jgi:hypothetical protein
MYRLRKIAARNGCRHGQDIVVPPQLVAAPSSSHGEGPSASHGGIGTSHAAHEDEEGGHQGGDQGEDDDDDDDDDDVDYDELGMSQLDDAPQELKDPTLLDVCRGRVNQWTGSL